MIPVSPSSRAIGKTVTVARKEAGYLRSGRMSQREIPSRARIPIFSPSAPPLEQLAEVRHGMVVKPPKSFRIRSGNRWVYTTFGKRFQPFRQAEAELVQQRFLFGRRFGNPAQADLTSIGGGQHDVSALQRG